MDDYPIDVNNFLALTIRQYAKPADRYARGAIAGWQERCYQGARE
jgi:hypothetical protein